VTIVRSQPPIPNSIYPTKEFGTLLLTTVITVELVLPLEHVPESCEDGILNLDPFVLKMYKEEITTYNRPQT
jgi:hypothetical protein